MSNEIEKAKEHHEKALCYSEHAEKDNRKKELLLCDSNCEYELACEYFENAISEKDAEIKRLKDEKEKMLDELEKEVEKQMSDKSGIESNFWVVKEILTAIKNKYKGK